MLSLQIYSLKSKVCKIGKMGKEALSSSVDWKADWESNLWQLTAEYNLFSLHQTMQPGDKFNSDHPWCTLIFAWPSSSTACQSDTWPLLVQRKKRGSWPVITANAEIGYIGKLVEEIIAIWRRNGLRAIHNITVQVHNIAWCSADVLTFHLRQDQRLRALGMNLIDKRDRLVILVRCWTSPHWKWDGNMDLPSIALTFQRWTLQSYESSLVVPSSVLSSSLLNQSPRTEYLKRLNGPKCHRQVLAKVHHELERSHAKSDSARTFASFPRHMEFDIS